MADGWLANLATGGAPRTYQIGRTVLIMGLVVGLVHFALVVVP